jgi:RHS repeat-associated protein
MKTILRLTALVYSVLIAVPTIQGQVATGTYIYGTYDTLGIDTVNVGNLNVHFSIPILNKAGRGLPFNYDLTYDSSVWYPATVNGVQVWVPIQGFGWGEDTAVATGYVNYLQSVSTRGACTTVRNYDFVYYDQFGVTHPFNGYTFEIIPSGNGTCNSLTPPTGSTSLATDGSGYTLNVTGMSTVALTSASGTQIRPPVQVGTGSASYTDSNGNQISVNSSGAFTDTTGNVVLTVAGNAPNPHTFTYTDTTGTPRAVTMSYKTYTVQTAFHCSGIGDYGPTSTSLVNSITLPEANGSTYTYTFSYETTPGTSNGNVTGRLASIELPQGGTIDYSYSGGSNGIECADGSTAGLTRQIASNADSAASSWVYTRTTGTGTSTTAVVDGLGNNKSYTFVEASNQPTGITGEYYETGRTVYQGAASGTLVVARNTCYNGATSPCATTRPTEPFSQIDTYETLNGVATHGSTSLFNTYGLQTELEIWDFALSASSRGPLLQKETWTYGGSLPSLVTVVSNSNGGATNYAYDGTTPTASSGVPQHIAVTGPRGNLTSMNQYSNPGTFYTSTMTYEDTGSLLSSVTPNGTTTLSYDPTFVYNTSTGLPTPSSGVALGVSISYDTTNTGLQLTSTDPNSKVTTIESYDPLLRPTLVEYADNGQTSRAYTPTSLTTTTAQTPNPSATSEDQFDGYGRLSRVETETSNGQFYQQDTCYDGNGNVSFTSYPYEGAGISSTSKVCSGSSAGVTYQYDVLGRVTGIQRANGGSGENSTYSYYGPATQFSDENGVTRISQMDGLGRPSILCEVSSAGTMVNSGSPVSCGTTITATGYVTTYSYTYPQSTILTTITQGSQTRTFQTDWLGRPIMVQEPESGTTTYSYAYNSTGLVITRQRPKANQTSPTTLTTTTTQYDSLNRVVSISYSDGTPTKTFAYDSSNGVSTGTGAGFTDLTQINLKGRLSLASVSGAGTAFSYDPVGRPSYLDECLPSGCGTVAYNRQLQYTYDLAGNILTSTDGSSTSTSYTVSPADEVLSMTSSLNNSTNPSDLISNVQNGPNGPISYNFGNGLSQYNSYDQLGRLNGGWVCVGAPVLACSAQDYGFYVNWRGSQIQLSSDDVTGQSNTYGYDGFNRLISMTNGSGQQMYSYVYDRWGNRWQQNIKTGSGPSPQYTFNTSTNQIVGYSYDAAGNMTNDSFHSYTYDGEGNVTAVDGGSTATYVYNSLNQRVRTSVGSTATEFVFNAGGQRVSEWNGTTRAQLKGKYYWAGTPVAFYTIGAGAAAHFEHQDWQGTERTRTTYNGALEGTFSSLPWGDAQMTVSGTDLDANHYATLDYDSETVTDHAQFRQYNDTQGRWMTPDPYGGSYDFSNPQSFNRYAYVANNPLSEIDSSGLCEIGRTGQLFGCGGGYGIGNDGTIDGIDEFDFMSIPVFGYGYFPVVLPDQSYSASFVNDGQYTIPFTYGTISFRTGVQIGWEQGYGYLGTGMDLLANWTASPGSGNGNNIGAGENAPSNAPTFQQKNQNCLNTINNTPDGNFYNTFSYTSSVIGPDASVLSFEQDAASEAGQRGAVGFLKATAKNWRSTALGSGSGFAANVWEAVDGFALTPLAVAATAGQLTVHALCATSAAF